MRAAPGPRASRHDRRSGDGDPCGGDIVDSDGNYSGSYNCWDRYFNSSDGRIYRRNLSTKNTDEFVGPPRHGSFAGVLQGSATYGNGSANPWHGVNRVMFERCSSWSGDREQIIHPTVTPPDYDDVPAAMPGDTVVYHHGERIAKTLFRYLASMDFSGATHVVLAAESDATIGLSHAADELARAIRERSPDTWVGVALDGYFAPMFEGEASFNANGDDPDGTNAAADGDTLYGHFGNRLGRRIPYPDSDAIKRVLKALRAQGIKLRPKDIAGFVSPPYSIAAYQEGGSERVRIDRYGWDLDQSCLEAGLHGDIEDISACYDHQHVFLNHLETPLFLSPDMDDAAVQTLNHYHGFYWTEMPFPLPAWRREDFVRRVRHQAITVAEHSPGPVGLFVTKRHVHTALLNQNSGLYVCRLHDAVVDRVSTLATALFDWMNDPAGSVPMIVEYSPTPGVTWHDEWVPGTNTCTD